MRLPLIALTLLLVAGCSDPESSRGEDHFNLEAQLSKASTELATLMAGHQEKWRLGSERRWDADQETGILKWTFDDCTVEAPCQIIGTYNPVDNTFLWGWDHPSVNDSQAQDAIKVFEYAKKHGLRTLQNRKLQCDPEAVKRLVALAVQQCERQGAYRGDAGHVIIYFTFGEVTIHPHDHTRSGTFD